ncbi:MAG: DUF1349 domain-containing protein [Chloroflexi bacterium AL-W]|nr:DUF1349 domain-containing protein [Chloroflexi bacterium AL-N1]NOK68520.1 DUF1349 domain-containing protein [Chloroflexi bacterium AL-N10]NOK74166.1 DUF1349 domain-containing protein [Chloroflexi bacterium AL-N5]NOK83133.1 DUF1349 domain-containing protein [Chloroflexi bacterium AL-W]NOK90656.1 DUF1349 domain-containing protein [Chloroflexi bacterium AL-N15]
MEAFTIPTIPEALHWRHQPQSWNVDEQSHDLTITAGTKTDWFYDPDRSNRNDNAPMALFTPPDTHFLLSAKVTVTFATPFDAGVLVLYEQDDVWAKLCFENSPQHKPMIVSVVTRGLSDDCNATIITEPSVFLRLYRNADTFAFHYSHDGTYWHLVRYFSLGTLTNLQVGFSSQSPTGDACTSIFSAMCYQQGMLTDIRNGN